MTAVRVRYAPSPTGYLHLGGVRTALYNWLWARRHGGVFVLRIEDTDVERSTEESVAVILDSMRWLGLDWDEGPDANGPRGAHGPYRQTERLALYREFADKLVEAGAAYHCLCTADDLARARAEHKARTGNEHGFRYPGTCRERGHAPGAPSVVRQRVPISGTVAWDDLVKGRLEFACAEMQDAVLLRQNGMPLYNLGAAVDDITMGITLVARGDDHVVNTPQQILIYQALGVPLPAFAHLPMILSPNGEKLSKRHAAVNVLEYRDQGYLPDAMLNYLARLGWSHGDQEIFTRAELVRDFDWGHVGRTGAKYDLKKLQSVQAEHLRRRPAGEVAEAARPFLAARGLAVGATDARLGPAVALAMPRATTLGDVADAVDFYFREPPAMDAAAAQKFLTPERADVLDAFAAVVRACAPFDRATLEARVNAWLAERGLALKEVAQPARVALTGRTASPGLYEVMEVLGKDRTLARLAAGVTRARGGA
jgi:glutamyl-tRNA synthetase